jgi:hypothetical protein
MQYGCAILQAGAMELLNNCRREWGMPWLRAISSTQADTPSFSQFPCLRAVEKEGIVWSEDKRDLRHRLLKCSMLLGREIVWSARGRSRAGWMPVARKGCELQNNTNRGPQHVSDAPACPDVRILDQVV